VGIKQKDNDDCAHAHHLADVDESPHGTEPFEEGLFDIAFV
jgi:hypothetical protein